MRESVNSHAPDPKGRPTHIIKRGGTKTAAWVQPDGSVVIKLYRSVNTPAGYYPTNIYNNNQLADVIYVVTNMRAWIESRDDGDTSSMPTMFDG